MTEGGVYSTQPVPMAATPLDEPELEPLDDPEVDPDEDPDDDPEDDPDDEPEDDPDDEPELPPVGPLVQLEEVTLTPLAALKFVPSVE
jgi:hypothetical protein